MCFIISSCFSFISARRSLFRFWFNVLFSHFPLVVEVNHNETVCAHACAPHWTITYRKSIVNWCKFNRISHSKLTVTFFPLVCEFNVKLTYWITEAQAITVTVIDVILINDSDKRNGSMKKKKKILNIRSETKFEQQICIFFDSFDTFQQVENRRRETVKNTATEHSGETEREWQND